MPLVCMNMSTRQHPRKKGKLAQIFPTQKQGRKVSHKKPSPPSETPESSWFHVFRVPERELQASPPSGPLQSSGFTFYSGFPKESSRFHFL